MTEKEKMIEIITPSVSAFSENQTLADVLVDIIADDLIDAGIGDVSAVKAQQEEIKLFNAEIKNGEIDMTVGSAGFKTFFALVEQIFKQNGAKAFLTTTIEGGNDTKYAVTIQRVGEKSPAEELKRATELCKHEKHRADVAERALRRACEHIDGAAETCAVCAKLADKLKVGEVCDHAENCVDNAIIFLTRQAEQEIAEEGKDE